MVDVDVGVKSFPFVAQRDINPVDQLNGVVRKLVPHVYYHVRRNLVFNGVGIKRKVVLIYGGDQMHCVIKLLAHESRCLSAAQDHAGSNVCHTKMMRSLAPRN